MQKARLRRTEGGGLWVGSDLQTSQPHIFAAGDVTGRARMLTPVCLMEGTAVGMRCAPAEATSKPAPTPPVNYSSVPSAVRRCRPWLAAMRSRIAPATCCPWLDKTLPLRCTTR